MVVRLFGVQGFFVESIFLFLRRALFVVFFSRSLASVWSTSVRGTRIRLIARASIGRVLLDRRQVVDLLAQPVELLVRLLGVRDLAAAEAHRELHLVAGLEEAARRVRS